MSEINAECLKKDFGKRIKALRTARKLSQAELAELVGVEALAISRIENGDHFVKAETLEALKNAFNISYTELFDFDSKEQEDGRIKTLIAHCKDMDDKAFECFLLCVKAYKKIHRA